MNLPLDTLSDDELHDVIDASQSPLTARDRARKQEAMREAQAVLARAGLRLLPESVGASKPKRRATSYRAGCIYGHPDDPGLRWNGTGPRPAWVKLLERAGRKPVEAADARATAKPLIPNYGDDA